MRPTNLRAARPRAIAGALLMTAPAAAGAAPGSAGLSTPPPDTITVVAASRSLRAGYTLDVHATAPAALVGLPARLEQQTVGGPWHSLAQAPVGPRGQVHFTAPAERSGLLRVSIATVSQTRIRARAAGAAAPSVSSPPLFVAVGARLQIGARRLSVLAGHPAWVRGRLLPATSGRRVVLEAAGAHGGWHRIAGSRSDRAGRYRLTTTTRGSGIKRLRVRFSGDGQNAAALGRLRPLEVFRTASVSTYGGSDGLDGSRLACGGTLSSSMLGVADRTLPCGTRITLRYGGHEVRVPVIDRGPYAGDREYDLTSATAARLGFSGTGEVWTTG